MTTAIEAELFEGVREDFESTEEASSDSAASQSQLPAETTLAAPRSSLDINRPELQRWLTSYAVVISDEDLRDATESQAEILWDWMESHIHQDEDEEGFKSWLQRIPDFVIWGESEQSEGGGSEVRLLKLVRLEGQSTQPVAVTPETTETTVTTPVLADELTLTRRHLAMITEASNHANKLRSILEDAESAVKAAKAHEKACLEDLHTAEKELSRVIADAKSGQQRLPFCDESPALYVAGVKTDVPGGDIAGFILNDAKKELSKSPIDELSTKSIKSLIGAIAFDAAKDADDPVGLSDSQIEKLVECEISTVEGLEKWMREDANWHRKINGFGTKAIDRVSSTLIAFRSKKPIQIEAVEEEHP